MKNKRRKTIIVVGYQCNNNCLFCSIGDADRKYNRSYIDIVDDIEKGYQKGCRAVEFIGGEVTMRDDIVDIVKKSKSIGYQEISFETNGRMFSFNNFTDAIIKAGLNRVLFFIHGHNNIIHDKLTQSHGSFDQAIEGIKKVNKYPEVIVNTNFVINKLNFKNIKDYLKFISQFNIFLSFISFLNPIGSALKNPEIIPKMSEVVPCLTEALENNYSFRIKIQNIPACLMIKYNEILVKAEDKKNSYMDSETRKEVSLTKEIKSLKIKPKICSQCVLNRECDGIWKGYHDIHGHKELTAINYYGKSRYKNRV